MCTASFSDFACLSKGFLFPLGSKDLDPNDPKYADELEREVGLFQKRLRILKAHLELITCFDQKRQKQSTLI